MSDALAGRSALVTGASRGIGRAVADVLAREGARVHLVARQSDRLESAAAEVGGRAWPTDLSDEAEVWETVEGLRESEGVPDIVVNAAGVFSLAPLAKTTVMDFDRNLALNLRAPFLVTRAVLPEMLRMGRGDLVNIGSVAGRRAFPSNGAYCSSKWGLSGLHEVLVEEVRGTGIRACLVEPAATDTPIWDPHEPDANPGLPSRSEMLRPEDVAEAVLFAVTRPEGVQIDRLPIGRS